MHLHLHRVDPSTWILYGLATSQLTSDEKISYNGKLTTITDFMEEASFLNGVSYNVWRGFCETRGLHNCVYITSLHKRFARDLFV